MSVCDSNNYNFQLTLTALDNLASDLHLIPLMDPLI